MCNVFIDTIGFLSTKKDFSILAYKINPDHVHLLIRTGELCNISEIIQSIKRNSNINMNKVIHVDDSSKEYQDLDQFDNLPVYAKMWSRKFNNQPNYFMPRFSWQTRFIESLIKSRKELKNVIAYLGRQHSKHRLPDNIYLLKNQSKILEGLDCLK